LIGLVQSSATTRSALINDLGELSQWLCREDSSIDIVVSITIIVSSTAIDKPLHNISKIYHSTQQLEIKALN